MSKGSGRRPGTGYADNWEQIFRKDTKVLQNRAKQSELSKADRQCAKPFCSCEEGKCEAKEVKDD